LLVLQCQYLQYLMHFPCMSTTPLQNFLNISSATRQLIKSSS